MTDPKEFIHILEQFKQFGADTKHFVDDEIPYYVNEFWTSKQRQGHSLHQISYRACFKSELPAFFIHYLTQPGNWVYDPFMGRGTTLVEAALMKRNVMGNDINPLSRLLVEPRLHHVTYQDVYTLLMSIPLDEKTSYPQELLAFYHPDTLQKLMALKNWIHSHYEACDQHHKAVLDWIRMVAINRLAGHSPGFFSGRTMPPNQAVSIEKQREFNKKFGPPPKRDVKEIILKKTRSLFRKGTLTHTPHYQLGTSKAWNTPWIKDGTVDLVVTSPPFLDVVNYKQDNWLRCWFSGIDPHHISIDTPSNINQWTEKIHLTLLELARILKPGGWIAFEVGEVRKNTLLLEKYVWKAAKIHALERVAVMVNEQNFTKTSNCWGVSNKKKGTNTNRIVLLRKI